LPLSRLRLRGGRREAKAKVEVKSGPNGGFDRAHAEGSGLKAHNEACSPPMDTSLLYQVRLRDINI